MSEMMELTELAQKFRNNASAVLTGDQVADEILNWAADFTIVRASSPAQDPVTTEPVAWTNEAQLGFLKEPGYRVVPMAMWAFQHSAHPIALYAIPAPPQPGRDEIARIIEARVLGGAVWEKPQASCYRAADAILALTGEPT